MDLNSCYSFGSKDEEMMFSLIEAQTKKIIGITNSLKSQVNQAKRRREIHSLHEFKMKLVEASETIETLGTFLFSTTEILSCRPEISYIVSNSLQTRTRFSHLLSVTSGNRS